MKYLRALWLFDCHWPFEDRRAYDLVIKKIAPKLNDLVEIGIGGDGSDFYSLSKYAKKLYSIKERKNFFISEVEYINRRLDQLDRIFPTLNKRYLEGNHENRLYTTFRDRVPELYGLTDCPRLFNLNKRSNWLWIQYEDKQQYRVIDTDLIARHENIGASAKTTAARSMCNIIYGHTHRAEFSQVKSLNGKIYRAWSCGGLGDWNSHPFKYTKNHNQWQHGFFIITIEKSTGNFYVDTILINPDYTCCVGGRIFRG